METLHGKWEDIAHPSFLLDSRCSKPLKYSEIVIDPAWADNIRVLSQYVVSPVASECSPATHHCRLIRTQCESRRSWLKTNECRNWSIKVGLAEWHLWAPLDRSMRQSPFHYSHYIALEERHKEQRQAILISIHISLFMFVGMKHRCKYSPHTFIYLQQSPGKLPSSVWRR